VHQALLQIPAEQRAAVVAVDIEGYSVVDAARALGVAEGTIKSRCARDRAKLAVILGHLRMDDVVFAGETGRNGNHSVPLCVTASNTYAGQEGR
ncbi:MAG: sigma factor-like helix-turn-helix DNA-binding protein, partial [Mycobacteriaceae bacterium]